MYACMYLCMYVLYIHVHDSSGHLLILLIEIDVLEVICMYVYICLVYVYECMYVCMLCT